MILEALASACRLLARSAEFNEFWVLSSYLDWSFEEGVRSAAFRRVVDAYVSAGLPRELVRVLKLGINGNLKEVLERPEFGLGGVVRNPGPGHDLLLDGARIEVKLVFDCTLPKYYVNVSADWDKLSVARFQGYPGRLFLVVFFVQLPGRRYRNEARPTVHAGIQRQFAALRKVLTRDPAFPSGGPDVHVLSVPATEHLAAGLRSYDARRGLPARETHDLHEQLRDAAVGFSIWECPAAMYTK